MCDFYRVRETDITLTNKIEERKNYYIVEEKEKYEMLYNNLKPRIVVPWCKIYKREIFNDIRYPIGQVHEDSAIITKLLYKVHKIAIFDEKLYFYLKRKTSITQVLSIDRLSELQNLKDRHEFFLKNLNNKEILSKNAEKICEYTIRYYKNISILNVKDKKSLEKRLYEEYKYYYNNYLNKKNIKIKNKILYYMFYKYPKTYNFIYTSLAKIYRKILKL